MDRKFQVEPGRIWLADAQGNTAAEVLFPDDGAGKVNITHTYVDDSLRGQGVAGKLMETLTDELRRQGKRAEITCSYAADWFSRHPENADILA